MNIEGNCFFFNETHVTKECGSFLIETHLQPSSTSTYHNLVSTETIKVKEVHGHHSVAVTFSCVLGLCIR